MKERDWGTGTRAPVSGFPGSREDLLPSHHLLARLGAPCGLVIDDELAGRTFHTEDEAKAALRERLPAREAA